MSPLKPVPPKNQPPRADCRVDGEWEADTEVLPREYEEQLQAISRRLKNGR